MSLDVAVDWQHIAAMRATTKAVRAALRVWPGTLRELARAADVPNSTLSRIATGERDASADVARAVARVCADAAESLEETAKMLTKACEQEDA